MHGCCLFGSGGAAARQVNAAGPGSSQPTNVLPQHGTRKVSGHFVLPLSCSNSHFVCNFALFVMNMYGPKGLLWAGVFGLFLPIVPCEGGS